jgi:hypothetical protein
VIFFGFSIQHHHPPSSPAPVSVVNVGAALGKFTYLGATSQISRRKGKGKKKEEANRISD